MDDGSLLAELQTMTRWLDKQDAVHQETLAYEHTIARQQYLHDLLRELVREVRLLRATAALLVLCFDDREAAREWQRSRAELRATPPHFRAPAKTLVAADVDLLHLVRYTAEMIATCRERRGPLRDRLERAVEASPESAHPDLRRALIADSQEALVSCWNAKRQKEQRPQRHA